MKLAFCLFKYFPYGGLQRDFLRIARACRDRGHDIHVYTMRWDGDREPGFSVHIVPARGLQNHTRCQSFIKKLQRELNQQHYDLVIGFNKMPDLDLYYAADVCYQARINETRSSFYQLLPRYKQWVQLEEAVFANGNQTEIMLISSLQQPVFTDYYQTEQNRFHLLPPGIAKDRIAPANAQAIRTELRKRYNIKTDDRLILMVGSGFKTKGLDRAIYALAALPENVKTRCHFFVIGQDDAKPFERLATHLQVNNHLHFLGGRNDVADFLLAADLLIHPAYHENTGTVLLEAMIAGLPVLTVDICGYAHYVKDANVGVVLTTPFQQAELNAALEKMLLSSSTEWQANGLAFAKAADIYSLPEKAADLIESSGRLREI